MNSSRLLALCFLAASCRPTIPTVSLKASDDATLRHTTSGDVIGGPGTHGSLAWVGIPFAAPPVGPLRWRAPEPPAKWTTPRQATTVGRACFQRANMLTAGERSDDGFYGAEDCLTLNVWAPADAGAANADARLPVMVWIHGGANSVGSSANYDLGHLATAQRVVAVAVNYRLGPLGWFRHAALREGANALDASGNFATLDLIRALEWVRDNAAAFGGDPSNVTIFGESAGGQNVYSLLVSPLAKGLFHRAIAQSPTLDRGTLASAENFADDPKSPGHPSSSNEVLVQLMLNDETAKDRAAAKAQLQAMTPAKIAAYLRAKTAAELFKAYQTPLGPKSLQLIDMPLTFGDGAVLPAARWSDAFATEGGWNRVPVMLGTNKEEAKLFLFLDPRFTWNLFGLLPRMRDEDKYEAASSAMSRLWRASAVDTTASAMRASGANAVYAYRFDWAREPTKLGVKLGKMLGAAHGLEVPFVLGTFEGQLGDLLSDGTTERDALSTAIMSYWGEFARTGHPGRGGQDALPEWRPYDPAPGATKFLTLDGPPAGLSMSNTVETTERVMADYLTDTRIPDLSERCEQMKLLVQIDFISAARAAQVKECAPAAAPLK